MTIYLDVVFLENTLLNFIILLSTGILSKTKVKFIKLFVASCIGGIFAITNYFINLNTIFNLIIKLVISIIIIFVAFSYKKIKFLKELILFYLISFFFGGFTFTLLFLIKPQNIIFHDNHLVGTYPIKISFFASIIGLFVIIIISKIRKEKNETIYELEIFYNGKCKKIRSLLDTGNLLKEPISKEDVIIVEKKELQDFIANEILDNITSIINGKWLYSNNLHSYNFRLIPFSSLGNENGLLIGFKPDYIKIYLEKEIIRNNVLIGIYDGTLSKNNLFTSLIGLDIIN